MTQLSLSGVAAGFGATVLFEDLTLVVARGERWGIVGRNGSGKTTLFRLLTGELQPVRGSIVRATGLRVSLLEQHRDFGGAGTIWDAAGQPFGELVALESSLEEQVAAIGNAGAAASTALLDRYGRDLERFQREGGYTYVARIAAVLQGLGFDPDQARHRPLASLSGGERGRLGLACQLVSPADVILLDEPTNHLDLETTEWLEGYLRSLDATVLLISHDRAFLDRAVDHVLHLEGGRAQPYRGGYSSFVTQRAERRLSEQRAYQKQARAIAAEEDFIRRNIAGQDTRQAKGRRRRLERLPRLSPPPGQSGAMVLRFEPASRGGDQVLVAENLSVAIGDRLLVQGFSASLRRNDIVGLIGPNGAGKSTLLDTLLGHREAARGVARLGDSTSVAFYDQQLAQVPLERTLFDIIHDLRPAWTRGQVQGHLGRYEFTGDSVLRRAGTLSGGERARVALAMMELARANLLVFDEPTNHLDVESIEALEDALEEFGGTVLLVSHDRALLRAVCTRLWVLHEGRITDFDGSFPEWEARSAERSHAARVLAEEEQVVRVVREQKRFQAAQEERQTSQALRRNARRRAEQAEAAVTTLETRLTELTRELEAPELYLTPDGVRRAGELGRELERVRTELERAVDEWARATEALEAAEPG